MFCSSGAINKWRLWNIGAVVGRQSLDPNAVLCLCHCHLLCRQSRPRWQCVCRALKTIELKHFNLFIQSIIMCTISKSESKACFEDKAYWPLSFLHVHSELNTFCSTAIL